MKAQPLFDNDGRYTGLWIECPGCEVGHHVVSTDWTPPGAERNDSGTRQQWHFDGNLEAPTLTPSVLMTCDYWGPERRKIACHSFVAGGRIRFLSDCTHQFAGQTLDLPEIPV